MQKALRDNPVYHQPLQDLQRRLNERIVGQERLIKRLIIALIADGHLLVEGAPGLAKTTTIKELAACVEGNFHRIQFTPDLLPSDITGTDIYRFQEGTFHFQQGPIFHNLILADEINRAPAKVQSALLEAMAERQVTIGRQTYPLPSLFLVMATQNPIEQEGTYTLPEAQLDRFLMYVKIDYPETSQEKFILKLTREQTIKEQLSHHSSSFVSQEMIFQARRDLYNIHLSQPLEEYLVQIVIATRRPAAYAPTLSSLIRFGASPRATIGLDRCARAHALLSNRDYVIPEDIHAVAPDILRHRILLTYEAEAEGVTTDQLIQELLNKIPVP